MNSKRNTNLFLVSLIFIFAIIAGWGLSSFYNNQKNNDHIDISFNLINHFGEEVSNEDFDNFNKVIFFGFTHCPDVCPMGVSVLSNVIDDLGQSSKNKFLFISVDPGRDTPERLNKYLSNFNDEIIGLTGNYESLKPVWDNFFVHVKSDNLPEQGSYSDLIDSNNKKKHESHDAHSHSHEADQMADDSYIVQHSAFYFIFDRKNNLENILPFGSDSEDILLELSKI